MPDVESMLGAGLLLKAANSSKPHDRPIAAIKPKKINIESNPAYPPRFFYLPP